jgi:hypothetical protein
LADAPTIAWTASQRRAIAFLLIGAVAYLSFRLAGDRTTLSDPQPARPARETELADRIDPNSADTLTLAALPGLGERRASDIVAFREAFERRHPGRRAFTRAEDLLKVRGIGYATMVQLAPHLIFPASTRAAPPSSVPGI